METVETREESYKTHVNVQRAKKDEMDSRDIQDCILIVTEKKTLKGQPWFPDFEKLISKWLSNDLLQFPLCRYVIFGEMEYLSRSLWKNFD